MAYKIYNVRVKCIVNHTFIVRAKSKSKAMDVMLEEDWRDRIAKHITDSGIDKEIVVKIEDNFDSDIQTDSWRGEGVDFDQEDQLCLN